jgi:hypothetical protein
VYFSTQFLGVKEKKSFQKSSPMPAAFLPARVRCEIEFHQSEET